MCSANSVKVTETWPERVRKNDLHPEGVTCPFRLQEGSLSCTRVFPFVQSSHFLDYWLFLIIDELRRAWKQVVWFSLLLKNSHFLSKRGIACPRDSKLSAAWVCLLVFWSFQGHTLSLWHLQTITVPAFPGKMAARPRLFPTLQTPGYCEYS
jgi:hypothetical protein